ncbi:MAG: tetratricopeptide repeat protein [Candidatus Omnitrophota bacterium]
MKKAVIILSILLIICLACGIFLFLQSKELQIKILQDEQIQEKIKKDLEAEESKNDKIKKENATLKAESIKIINLKNEAEKNSKNFQEEYARIEKELVEKDAQMEELFKLYEAYEKSDKTADTEALTKKVDQLTQEIKKLKQISAKEKSIFYYNLGVVYTQAKFYEQAIEAYQKSLDIDKNNPEANFNLGLIYQNFKKMPEIATVYYCKYLELNPKAKDKQKVKDWLDNIYSVSLAP